METPQDLKYSNEHVWVKTEGDDTAILGITDFGQESLGEITFFELPEVDLEVGKDEIIIAVGSSKAFVDLPSPATGKVVATNDAVNIDPTIVNSSPYVEGWLVKMQINTPSELEELMDSAGYETFVAEGSG